MAIAAATSAGGVTPTGRVVYPASVQGHWSTIITDLEATAETTALLRPQSAVSTYITPVVLGGNCTRFLVRARYTDSATITTNPVVRIYGGYYDVREAGLVDDGTKHCLRLDNVDSDATGLTVTMDEDDDLRDTTYAYSDCVPDLDGIDAKGAWFIWALIETAGNVGTGTPILQIMPLN